MKLMFASDIHGDIVRAEEAMATYEKEKAEKLILLGDLLYFGPRNQLTENYNPQAVIKLLNKNKNELICVRGNCDAEVDQMVLDFPIMAEYAYLCIDGFMILLTHGHKINTETAKNLRAGEILIHGHTHIPAWTPFGEDHLYLNPGSVSIPKENSPHSYMIFDGEKFEWKTLEGEVYKEYVLYE